LSPVSDQLHQRTATGLKMAVLAPMPKPIVITAVAAKT